MRAPTYLRGASRATACERSVAYGAGSREWLVRTMAFERETGEARPNGDGGGGGGPWGGPAADGSCAAFQRAGAQLLSSFSRCWRRVSARSLPERRRPS